MNANGQSVGHGDESSQAVNGAATALNGSHPPPSTDSGTETAQRERWGRIPRELRERRQWVLAGPGKDPLTSTGGHAKVNNPSTWTDFETACNAAIQRGLRIGYVLSDDDPFSVIDLDVCDAETQAAKGKPIDPSKWTTPEQFERFNRVLELFKGTYIEKSKSGKGWHIWVLATFDGKGKKRDGVELYCRTRHMVFTGDATTDDPIVERQELVQQLWASLNRGSAKEVELEEVEDDVEGWYIAEQARNDAGKMGALFREGTDAGFYSSPSEADLALVTMLCRLTDSNATAWEAFKYSILGKRKDSEGKVKSHRDSYRDPTLKRARTFLADEAMEVAHGKEIAERLFWKPAPAGDGSRLRLFFDNDLRQLPRQGWLLKNIIPDSGVGVIYGASQTYKSFLALDLLAHISNGQPWFGQRVKAAPAVYVPFEGKGGVPKRVDAWRLARARQIEFCTGLAPDWMQTRIAYVTEPLNLRQQSDRDKLVQTLTEQRWAGGVLCIDTLAQAGGGIDENSSEGMGEMVAVFQELQHRLGGVVLVIHHTGKVLERGLRGWSGLGAALDFTLLCWKPEKAGKYEAELYIEKVKDEETGLKFSFSMMRVGLGHDDDGDEITSLVVTPPPGAKQLDLAAPSTDVQRDAEDDEFIFEWVRKTREENKFPSANSLYGQLAEMKQAREITRERVKDAIHRLKAKSRLVQDNIKSPSGNPFLRTSSEAINVLEKQ